ncbi:MAG: ABC transporter substrate-binding protein [Steroidobacter sp.]
MTHTLRQLPERISQFSVADINDDAIHAGSMMVSRVFAVLVTALLALGAHAAPPKVIRIAAPDLSAGAKPSYGGQVDYLNTNQLLEKEFARDGIKIEWSFFKGAGPGINEALANRQLDFAFIGDLPLIIGRANGLDTRLLAASTRGVTMYLAVTPESGIKSFEDLKGKRVGIFRGTADQLSFARVLERAGLKERDVKVVNLDFNAVNAALVAKQIDATWAPHRLLALRDRGIVNIPVSTKQLDGAGSLQGGLVGAQAFLHQHPDVTTRVVKTVLVASRWLSTEENRQAQVQLVASQSSYPAAAIEESLRGSNLAFVYSPLLDGYFLDNFKRNVELARQFGLIRRTFDVNAWVDDRYLSAALQQLGWQNAWKPYDHYAGGSARVSSSSNLRKTP